MQRTPVSDVMTRQVVTLRPETPFTDIVRTLSEHRISGAPVVGDDGQVLGVVSESDLLHKEEFKSPLEDFPPRFETRRHRDDRRRAEGATAADVMSRPPVCLTHGSTTVEAARLMAHRRINRLPIVTADGTLTGIVTRGDLLRVFLRSDDQIRDEILNEVIHRYLWQDVKLVEVTVVNGVVTMAGTLDLRSLIPIAVRLAGAVEGVVRVIDQLDYDQDDTAAEARLHRR